MSVLYFATEARFIKSNKGIYTLGAFEDTLWERYLSTFDKVVVIARVQNVPNYTDAEKRLIKNPNVTFLSIPYYHGPIQYLRVRSQLFNAIKKSIDPYGSYICRVPGKIGSVVVKFLKQSNHKFACEVVGDPWDVWSGTGPQLLLRPALKISGYRSLRKTVATADAVLYVTREALQRRYPASSNAFTTNASNVILNSDFTKQSAKIYKKGATKINVLCTGALAQMYKAPDVVLKAVKMLHDHSYPIYLKWLGGGRYLENMRSLSKELGLSEFVNFVGSVQRSEVITSLEEADIFIMASRTEGMPRALIEAMAAGLPCIGTNIGGIPELLDSSVLIPKNDPGALAAKLKDMIENPEFANKQAERNFQKAKNYREDVLREKRMAFYEFVKNMR